MNLIRIFLFVHQKISIKESKKIINTEQLRMTDIADICCLLVCIITLTVSNGCPIITPAAPPTHPDTKSIGEAIFFQVEFEKINLMMAFSIFVILFLLKN